MSDLPRDGWKRALGEASLTVLICIAVVLSVCGVTAIVDEAIDRGYQGICHGAGYSGYTLHDGSRYCFLVEGERPSVVLLEDLLEEAPRGQ